MSAASFHGERPSAIAGNLEDLSLHDMLQVISFSKKTGYLLIESPSEEGESMGDGGLVLDEGRLICAFSPSTLELLHLIGTGHRTNNLDATMSELIELALRELLSLTGGTFRFQLVEELEPAVGGADISCFLERPGLDIQKLLLKVAKEVDQERLKTRDLLSQAGFVAEVVPEVLPKPKISRNVPKPTDAALAEDPSVSAIESPHILADTPEMRCFLNEMTSQLLSQESGVDISRIVLEVSHRFYCRSFLFLVKQGHFSCLDVIADSNENATQEQKVDPTSLSFSSEEAPIFARTVVEAKRQKLTARELLAEQPSLSPLYSPPYLRSGSAEEAAHLMPVISNREVVAILFCDGRRSYSEEDLHAMGLFVSQAGLALENRFLRRRLSSFRDALKAQ